MATTDELLDILMKDYKKPEDLIGENGLLKQLTKRLLERAMQTELTEHLGYEKHAPTGKNSGNSRNGGYKKTISGDFGNLDITTPRDRNSTFEPVILPKGETRFTGFDDKIISMYARGMTTRDIQGHLQEIYGIDVSPALISQFTDAISEEVYSGRTAQWTRSTQSSITMLFGSRCAMTVESSIRRSISLSASIWKASKKSLVCGHQKTRAQSSGFRLSLN